MAGLHRLRHRDHRRARRPAARPPGARRFGRATLDALDRLSGLKGDPIDPLIPAEAPQATLRFAEPVMTVEGIAHALGDLVAMLAEVLGKRGRARAPCCSTARGSIMTGSASPSASPAPSRDADHIRRLLAMRIEEIEPGFGIEAMTLTATRADPLTAEAMPGALTGEPPVPELAVLVDRLATRLGRRRLWRPGMAESEVPERAQVRHGPLAQPALLAGRLAAPPSA